MNMVLNNFILRLLAFVFLSFGCGFAVAKAVHKTAQLPGVSSARPGHYFYSAQPVASGRGAYVAA